MPYWDLFSGLCEEPILCIMLQDYFVDKGYLIILVLAAFSLSFSNVNLC